MARSIYIAKRENGDYILGKSSVRDVSNLLYQIKTNDEKIVKIFEVECPEVLLIALQQYIALKLYKYRINETYKRSYYFLFSNIEEQFFIDSVEKYINEFLDLNDKVDTVRLGTIAKTQCGIIVCETNQDENILIYPFEAKGNLYRVKDSAANSLKRIVECKEYEMAITQIKYFDTIEERDECARLLYEEMPSVGVSFKNSKWRFVSSTSKTAKEKLENIINSDKLKNLVENPYYKNSAIMLVKPRNSGNGVYKFIKTRSKNSSLITAKNFFKLDSVSDLEMVYSKIINDEDQLEELGLLIASEFHFNAIDDRRKNLYLFEDEAALLEQINELVEGYLETNKSKLVTNAKLIDSCSKPITPMFRELDPNNLNLEPTQEEKEEHLVLLAERFGTTIEDVQLMIDRESKKNLKRK